MRRNRERGFALAITLVLMAFIVLLLLSLVTLTQVETRLAASKRDTAEARQNALTALSIALGQLQQTTGPDQRVTARADLHFSSPANRYWTGVYANRSAANYRQTVANIPASDPVLISWLVSGNEGVPFSSSNSIDDFGRITSASDSFPYSPEMALSVPGGLASASALSNITLGGSPARLLVGPNSVGSNNVTDYVVAPLVDISPAGSSGEVTGRYAWWIGDEGTKANLTLVESENTLTATPDSRENRLRYQSPARFGIEAMGGATGTVWEAINLTGPDGSTLRENLRRMKNPGELPLISLDSTLAVSLQDEYRAGFHDLTSNSLGVIADSYAGGLKRDLSAAFGTPALPGELNGQTIFPGGPQWNLLHNYARLSIQNTGVPIMPRGQTDTQHGFHPIVTHWQLFVEAYLVSLGGDNYRLELRHYPAIILWNPYNVAMADQTYQINYLFADSTYRASFFARVSKGSSSASNVAAAVSPEAQVVSPWFFHRHNEGSHGPSFRVKLQSGIIPPGHAYVYSLADNVRYASPENSDQARTIASSAQEEEMVRGWHIAGGPKGFIIESPVFHLPALDAADPQQYLTSFFYHSHNGTAEAQASSDSAKGPPLTPWDRPTINLSSSTEIRGRDMFTLNLSYPGNHTVPIHRIERNHTRVRLRPALINNPLSPGSLGFFNQRWTLKTSDGGSLDALSSDNNPIRWLANYNPRATYSLPSAYESQATQATGYFNANPSYNRPLREAERFGIPFSPASTTFSIPFFGTSSEGRAYIGMSDNSWDMNDSDPPQVTLFHIPSVDSPLLSIGALQHASLYRSSNNDGSFSGDLAENFLPAYPVGNSLADPRVGLDTLTRPRPPTTISGSRPFLDHSFLLNRALWDRFYFSSVSPGQPITWPLDNPRFTPYLKDTVPPEEVDLRSYEQSSANLLLEGAFNINSTSEKAWRALLTSLTDIPVGSTSHPGRSPLLRIPLPTDDSAVIDLEGVTNNADLMANAYRGYRSLTSAEINDLAREVVAQVRRRGPFVSLADFVNRALVDPQATDTEDSRYMGALAQAINDAGLNQAFTNTNVGHRAILPAMGLAHYTPMPSEIAHDGFNPLDSQAAFGVPGWITQADILQSLGSVMSARSDTFVIRTYGEALNPSTGSVTGRAWCEALVQRLPDYIDPDDPAIASLGAATHPSATNATNQEFGRRYQILSIRWLSADQI